MERGGRNPYRVLARTTDPNLRSSGLAADVRRSGRRPRPQLQAGATALPAYGKEVTEVKDLLKRMWYSPALLIVLVYVLGAPRKWPKG